MSKVFKHIAWVSLAAVIFGVVLGGSSLLLPQTAHAACGNGYSYCQQITIDHTQAGASDSSNFTLEATTTQAVLATVGNSGHIQNTTTQTGSSFSGNVPADLIVTSDSACATKLNWEIEDYSATTGRIKIWFKEGTLSHTVDGTAWICYGNSSVTTWQGNVNSTWDSTYKGVWHFPNGSTLDLHDSTSNANTGTSHFANAATGQIDGGVTFSSSYVDVGNGSSLQITGGNLSDYHLTIEAWADPTSFANFGWILAKTNSNIPASYEYRIDQTNGKPDLLIGNGSSVQVQSTASGGITSGVWNHIVVTVTYTGGTGIWDLAHYLNGASNGTTHIVSNNSVTGDSGTNALISTRNDLFSDFLGSMDEVRISNVTRSADWVTAEYNNTKAGSTMVTFGAEQSSGGAAATPPPKPIYYDYALPVSKQV